MDNTGWNAVKQSTLRVFPEGEAKQGNEFESNLAPKVAFTKVGEAFGAYGEEVSDPADVPAAIARCLKEVRGGRSALLHARVTKMYTAVAARTKGIPVSDAFAILERMIDVYRLLQGYFFNAAQWH